MGIIFYYFSIKFINPNKYSKAQLIVFNKGKICRSLKHSQASNSRGSWCCRWHRRRGRRPPCRVSRAPWTNTCNMFDKYMLQLWQIYVTTLTNICDNFDKYMWQLWQIPSPPPPLHLEEEQHVEEGQGCRSTGWSWSLNHRFLVSGGDFHVTHKYSGRWVRHWPCSYIPWCRLSPLGPTAWARQPVRMGGRWV